MRVLVACEFSGIVRNAFIAKGHNAISCDFEPTELDGPHYQGDVMDIISGGWDLMIAHPPCQYLAVVGRSNWSRLISGEQDAALSFVRKLMDAPINKIAIENPVGVISTRIRKPDQYVQPYMFGHQTSKKTGLWLKNLPLLIPENIVEHNGYSEAYHISSRPLSKRTKDRSRTYQGLANAMANQWGNE